MSSTEEDGFARYRVHLAAEDVIPAYLAVPTGGGPFPAVVIFHQHAGQRHLGKSEVIGLIGDKFRAFGPPLARVVSDSIAFEGRRPAGEGTDPRDDDWDQHYNELAYRLVVGETVMHKVLQDAMVAVSALSAREDVDSDRLGALESERFDAIIRWMTKAASAAP
jgi:dienelactone hydrolase